jgi:hypothetical protein
MERNDNSPIRLPASIETLSTFAVIWHDSDGRGAVIADRGVEVEMVRGSRTGTRLTYLVEGSHLYTAIGGWPSDDVRRSVADYDPETEFVLILTTDVGAGFEAYVLELSAPAEALRPRDEDKI